MSEPKDFYKDMLDNLYDGVYFVDRDRKILYWNKGAERITGYSSPNILGQCCWNNILMHINDKGENLCKDLCPLAKTIQDGETRETEVFLHHKNGHRVPVIVKISPIKDELGNITGAVEVFHDNSTKHSALERAAELEKIAYIDHLTGLANRRYTEIVLNARFNEFQRYNWHFGVLMMDINNFKTINDTYGHNTGDKVLQTVARTLSNTSRAFDVVGRWGGDEFLAVIANIDQEKLIQTADRFRAFVDQSTFTLQGNTSHLTISIGATLALPDDDIESLIRRADELMYQEKARM